MIPQIIYIVLLALSFGLDWERHGQPKKGNYNAWISAIAIFLIVLVLWWGGFWDCFYN